VAAGASHSMFLGSPISAEGLSALYFAGLERRHPSKDMHTIPRGGITDHPKLIQYPAGVGCPRVIACAFDQCAFLSDSSTLRVCCR